MKGLARPQQGTESVYSISVFDDLHAAAPLWQRLEAQHPGHIYQKFTWCAAWFGTIGVLDRVRPAIVHIEAGDQSALLPLAIYPWHQLRIARYPCGSHSNANGPLAGPQFPWPDTADGINDLLCQIAAAIGDIDSFALQNQPQLFNGVPHPFLPAQSVAGASDFYEGDLAADFNALSVRRMKGDRRKKMRNKERRIAELGMVRMIIPATADEARYFLSQFFLQKQARFRQQGIANPFDEPGAVDFLNAAACDHFGMPEVALRLRAMFLDDALVAIWGSIQDQMRYSGLITSFAVDGEVAKCSPGELLLNEEIRHCCTQGQDVIDLGIGAARYKNVWCDRIIPIFETHFAMTNGGWLYAAAQRCRSRAKRLIKNNPALMTVTRKLRGTAD